METTISEGDFGYSVLIQEYGYTIEFFRFPDFHGSTLLHNNVKGTMYDIPQNWYFT